ncbi:DNA polymerase III subunit delta' [Uliginosibacterium gangwonense]|uniref:DNA polymerase III subunit delta' n=1 Tax=Uliginosibacterium gangwonense TaxID=392736 RepID=UPI00036E96D9|nr:DNA polymerase III subunit delta' [Uliginosibacterium gangwonense]
MSQHALPEWLISLWQDITARRDRLPHALLLTGAPGSGKRLFAEQLCAALLCQHPDSDGFACGQCNACHWLASGNHPDVLRVVPAADQEEAGEEGEGAETPTKKEKSRSSQIVIDQVRAIQSVLEVGAGGRRVVIVEPAEAMNVAAANAMLKMLEEPGQGTVFLLVCHAPRRLLPTILSRCQRIDFGRPSAAQVKNWVAGCGIKDAEALLGFCSGLPLLVERMHQQGLDEARRQFATELVRLPNSDPLKLAAQWETRLKAKDADERGLSLALLISWIQRWLADGARVANGIAPRFYLDYQTELAALSNGRSEAWTACFREFHTYRGVAQHPLNLRLFLEEMLLVLHRRTTVVRR